MNKEYKLSDKKRLSTVPVGGTFEWGSWAFIKTGVCTAHPVGKHRNIWQFKIDQMVRERVKIDPAATDKYDDDDAAGWWVWPQSP